MRKSLEYALASRRRRRRHVFLGWMPPPDMPGYQLPRGLFVIPLPGPSAGQGFVLGVGTRAPGSWGEAGRERDAGPTRRRVRFHQKPKTNPPTHPFRLVSPSSMSVHVHKSLPHAPDPGVEDGGLGRRSEWAGGKVFRPLSTLKSPTLSSRPRTPRNRHE